MSILHGLTHESRTDIKISDIETCKPLGFAWKLIIGVFVKKSSIGILALICFINVTQAVYGQDSVKCVINVDGNMKSFIRVNGDFSDTSDGVTSIEKFELDNFKFLLKEGHGTLFLEVYRKNRFHAGTLISTGSITPKTYLNLRVINDKNIDLEAYCDKLREE